jgi:hypothetical protein
MSRSFFALARRTAALGLVLAITGATGCAQVLGIEDTRLEQGDAGPPVDPCVKPLVPYLWFFADKLNADGAYPLAVLTQETFNGIATLLTGAAPNAQRGHLSVDMRSCENAGQFPSAAAAKLVVSGSATDATTFYITTDGTPTKDLEESTAAGIGGVINLAAGNPIVRVQPTAFGTSSAERAVQIRPGFLTTVRLEPNSQATVKPAAPPAEWACVGDIAAPVSQSKTSLEITATIVDFRDLQTPVPGVQIKVCARNDAVCDLGSGQTPDAVSDANGQATIKVNTPNGLFDGFFVVRGAIRDTSNPACKADGG